MATEAATTIATEVEARTARAKDADIRAEAERPSISPKVFPPLPSLSHHLVLSLLDLLVETKHLVGRLEGGKNL